MKFFRTFYFALIALLGLCGAVALGNYTMTQGAGTNFGSVIIGGVHYAQQFICDLSTPGQCASVSAAGAVKTDGSAVTQPVSATSLPLPTGAATDASLTSIHTALGSPMQNSGGSVTANAGTNLNTSALALESGGNLASLVTNSGAPGSVACSTDTSSCNQNQQMQRLAQRLTTINTTLGSPFQAGASIGNTSFGATQSGTWTVQPGNTANTTPWLVSATQSGTWNIANITGTVPLPTGASTAAKQPAIGIAGTASTDVLTVQGIASMTPLLATLSGTNNINNISGTISLPTGAATSANQTNASQKTQIVDGLGNVIASTSNNLNVQCANCSGSGASAADEATFTAGTSVLAPGGGFYQTTATNNPLTTGQQGMVQMTANRAFFTNLRNASGTEIGTNGNPLRIDPVGTTTQPVSGTVTVTQSTAANLNMTCANCSGSGASGTDEAAFTAGSSVFAPAGGFFQTTATSNPLTNGQWGTWQMTANRAGFVNLRNASGTEIGTSSTPVQVSLANTGSNATAVSVSQSGAPWSQNLTQIGGLSPSATNPLWINGAQATSTAMQSAAVANGNGTNLTVTGYQTALVNVNCSVACSGGTTINFEGTDSTGTFFSVAAYPVAGTSTAVSSATTSGQFWVPVSGLTSLRARISAYSVGTITVTGTPVYGVNAGLSQVVNTNANGQQTMANSSPVVIASNQSALTVNNATASNLLASVSGATSNASSAVATSSTNIPAVSYNYGYNGTTWDQLQVDGSKNLKINCVTGCSGGTGGTSATDQATFTYGTTSYTPIGGVYNSSITSLTSGQGGALALTADRNAFVNLNKVAGTALGAPSNYGTSPGAVAVLGTNSFVTNTVATNVSQIGGNSVLTGNGTSGTGSQRVNIASDNSAVAGFGVGATGSASPANAIYNGTLQSGATGGQLKGTIQCDQTATYDASTSGSTQIVALASGQTIYVCGYAITTGGTATNVKLVYGTGTNCVTSPSNLTPAYQLVANGGIVDRAPFWGGMKTASANALCINASAANAVQATVYYAQF